MGKLHEVGKITVLYKGDDTIWLVSSIRPEFIKPSHKRSVEDFKCVAGVFETGSLGLKRTMNKSVNPMGIYQKENKLDTFGKFVMFPDGGFMIFNNANNHAWTAEQFDYDSEALFAGAIEVLPGRVHTFGTSISLRTRASSHGVDEKFIREHFDIPHPIKPATQPIKAT